jgi:hypothetical protein
MLAVAGLPASRPEQVLLAPVIAAMERIEQVVGEETAALLGNRAVDLATCNYRKSHALLELTRATRCVDAVLLRERLGPELHRLRRLIEENCALLQRHLTAVQEVCAIVAESIRETESDGTYSPRMRYDQGF